MTGPRGEASRPPRQLRQLTNPRATGTLTDPEFRVAQAPALGTTEPVPTRRALPEPRAQLPTPTPWPRGIPTELVDGPRGRDPHRRSRLFLLVAVIVLLAVDGALLTWRFTGQDRPGVVSTDGTTTGGVPAPTPSAPPDDSTAPSEAPDSPTAATAPQQREGDLDLSTPISRPACDGSWVVFVGSAVDAATYADDVAAQLAAHPGAAYLLTESSCSSLRQRLPDGRSIYAVYLGPFATQAAACAERNSVGVGVGAYVKVLDNATPAEQIWEC